MLFIPLSPLLHIENIKNKKTMTIKTIKFKLQNTVNEKKYTRSITGVCVGGERRNSYLWVNLGEGVGFQVV